jgi:hypothetical protein
MWVMKLVSTEMQYGWIWSQPAVMLRVESVKGADGEGKWMKGYNSLVTYIEI